MDYISSLPSLTTKGRHGITTEQPWMLKTVFPHLSTLANVCISESSINVRFLQRERRVVGCMMFIVFVFVQVVFTLQPLNINAGGLTPCWTGCNSWCPLRKERVQADYIGCTMLNSIKERKEICDSDSTKHVTLAFSVIVSNQLSLRAQLAGRAAGNSHESFLKSVGHFHLVFPMSTVH